MTEATGVIRRAPSVSMEVGFTSATDTMARRTYGEVQVKWGSDRYQRIKFQSLAFFNVLKNISTKILAHHGGLRNYEDQMNGKIDAREGDAKGKPQKP